MVSVCLPHVRQSAPLSLAKKITVSVLKLAAAIIHGEFAYQIVVTQVINSLTGSVFLIVVLQAIKCLAVSMVEQEPKYVTQKAWVMGIVN